MVAPPAPGKAHRNGIPPENHSKAPEPTLGPVTARKGAPVPTVTIDPTGERVHLDPGETILAGLYKAGYAFTVGCRRGGCAICKVDAVAGTFTYNRPVADSVITDEERADHTCLTCRAVPEGDVTIRLRGETLRLVNPFLAQLNARARQRAEAYAASRAAASPDATPPPAADTTPAERTTKE